MRAIQITGNFTALVDEDNYEVLSQSKWCFHKPKRSHTVYAKRFISKGNYGLMHREIMGAVKGQYVDHIDGNGLNNQKANLRFCNQHQNGGNAKKYRESISKFKGVWQHPSFQRKKRWQAYINPNRKKISLGYYETEEEAALAYNRAALIHFGEFSKLNEVK